MQETQKDDIFAASAKLMTDEINGSESAHAMAVPNITKKVALK